MIQRKQTIWLLLASICSFLTIKFPFYSGNLVNTTTQQKTFAFLTAKEPSLLILILTISIGASALILIFMYKDRPKQLLASIITAIVALGNLLLYYLETKKFTDGTISLSALVAVFIPIFLLLAAIGINKDEKLIKSADRLR